MTFTYLELQKCAEREAALRRNVYKRHKKDSMADVREIAMMDEIALHFKALVEPDALDVRLYKAAADDPWVSRR